MFQNKKLKRYQRKRDFRKTQEPKENAIKKSNEPCFVIQMYDVSPLHYDFVHQLIMRTSPLGVNHYGN
ncbi:hypothetical protein [Legionella sp. 227]|uniref:hypothetical protein n=1 Tax=Legionella sp. 227 TaxID=3367288 RepID=UPI00370DB918